MKKCPTCNKSVGFHYTFTTCDGVFCSEECYDKGKEPIISRIKTLLYQGSKNPRDRKFLIMDVETEMELKESVYFAHHVSSDLTKFMGMHMAVVVGLRHGKILEIR